MGFFPTIRSLSSTDDAFDASKLKVAIIGGSLGGLATANVLHRLGASVTVFEKSATTLESRGACLGFVDVALWERIRELRLTRDGKQVSHRPVFDGMHSFDQESQGSFYYGDMWQFLYSGLPEGCVKFGRTVETLGDPEAPTIDGETFDLAIVADGGWSTLRDRYIESKRAPEYTGYQIYWGRVDAADLPDALTRFGGQTEWSGIYNAVILPVPHNDGKRSYMSAFFVATPEDEIKPPERGDNRQLSQTSGAKGECPEWFLPFVRRLFARHAGGQVLKFTEAALEGKGNNKITPSPVFEFGVNRTVSGRVVVMGDAAHMASPFTAGGAHTAMLDAVALGEALAPGAHADLDAALRSYDKGGVQRTKALLRQSRAVTRLMLPKQGKHAVPSPAEVALAPP